MKQLQQQIDKLNEENSSLEVKNKKWIKKLDEEIDKNNSLQTQMQNKIKSLQEEKHAY